MEPDFTKGLLTTVVVDATTKDVLMVAWMNEASYRLTKQTGETWFWSRSRQELWHKEGSYTDYLFTKGLDKILKKIGEETTEVIVAAKNEGTAELQYETADLLYHLMVLLVEQGLTYDDIKEELGKREGLMSDFKDRPEIKDL